MKVKELIKVLSKLSNKEKEMRVFYWGYTDEDYEITKIDVRVDDEDGINGVELC